MSDIITLGNSNTRTDYFEYAHGILASIYPCRCGEIHRGEYACERFLEHECFHDDVMISQGLKEVACGSCGKFFDLEQHG